MLHCSYLIGFWICLRFSTCQGSEYAGVLNILGFWIYQGSEYASGSQYARVLNISGLLKVLNMSDCAWICLNMPEYARICMNIPSACLLISACCHCNPLSIYFNKVYSLKEHEAVFLKRQNFIFSVVAGSISFFFVLD